MPRRSGRRCRRANGATASGRRIRQPPGALDGGTGVTPAPRRAPTESGARSAAPHRHGGSTGGGTPPRHPPAGSAASPSAGSDSAAPPLGPHGRRRIDAGRPGQGIAGPQPGPARRAPPRRAPHAGVRPRARPRADSRRVVIGNSVTTAASSDAHEGRQRDGQVVARLRQRDAASTANPMQVVTGDAAVTPPGRCRSSVTCREQGVIPLNGQPLGVLRQRAAPVPRRTPRSPSSAATEPCGCGTRARCTLQRLPLPAMALGAVKGLADLGHKNRHHLLRRRRSSAASGATSPSSEPPRSASSRLRGQVSLAQPISRPMHPGPTQRGEGIQSAVDGPSIAPLSKSCAQQGYKPQYMGISLAIIDKSPGTDAGGHVRATGELPVHLASDAPTRPSTRHPREARPSLANSPAVGNVWSAEQLLRERW